MRGWVFLFLLIWGLPVAASELPGEGPLADPACIACHLETTTAWRSGPHGTAPEAGCVACHGETHIAAGSRARRSKTCTDCHGGKKGATARSYRTSKHGVIETLEGADWDWSGRLADANYRAPTCAYCHMHDGAHGRMLSVEVLETSCLDCHSPRYVETLLAAGARMIAIGDLKLAEAAAATGAKPEPGIARMLETMQTTTLRNLRLGVGHQSPDYQWWYGHAALDGDLLRIKSALSQRARR
jgi:hypothetical protein